MKKLWLAVASITLLIIPMVNADDGGGEVLGFAEILNTPYSGIVDTQINFTGGTTGGVAPFTYAWDFDYDGTTFDADSNEQNPNHTYTSTGTYTVALNITDSSGNFSIDTTVCVVYEECNSPPYADFVYRPRYPTIGELVRFYDLSVDLDGTISSWSWTFGDKDSDTMKNPNNRYNEAGTYVVKLTVTDDDGLTATHSEILRVYEKKIEDGKNYTIVLYFVDKNANPLERVDVHVYRDGERIFMGMTDENGSVKFECIGNITITGERTGYKDYHSKIVVYKDMPIIIEMQEKENWWWLWWVFFIIALIGIGVFVVYNTNGNNKKKEKRGSYRS